MNIYVANTGRKIITDCIGNIGTPTSPNYIAWGVGTTSSEVTDTALESESAEARTAGTDSEVTTVYSSDTYKVVGTIVCTGSAKAITEVGLFDANAAGNMLLRSTFAAKNVSVGDSIEFTFTIVFRIE